MKKVLLSVIGVTAVAGTVLGVKLTSPSRATKASNEIINFFHKYSLPPVVVPSDLDAIKMDQNYELQNDKVWNDFGSQIDSIWASAEHSGNASGDWVKAGGIDESPNNAKNKLAHMIGNYLWQASFRTVKANQGEEAWIVKNFIHFDFQAKGHVSDIEAWDNSKEYPVIVDNAVFGTGAPAGIFVTQGRTWKEQKIEPVGDSIRIDGWAALNESPLLTKEWQGRTNFNLPVYQVEPFSSQLETDQFGPLLRKQYDEIMAYWYRLSGHQPPQVENVSSDFLAKLNAIPINNLPHSWQVTGENPIKMLSLSSKMTRYSDYFSPGENLIVLSYPAPKVVKLSNYILLVKESEHSFQFDPDIRVCLSNIQPMVWGNGIYCTMGMFRFAMRDWISEITFHEFTTSEPVAMPTTDTVDADGNDI